MVEADYPILSTQRGLFASAPDPAAGTLARAAVDRSGSFPPPSSKEVEEDYGRRNGWCIQGLAALSICHWAKRSQLGCFGRIAALDCFSTACPRVAMDDGAPVGKGIDRSTPMGRRDYAQYLLFCAYGLSNAEIIDLKLEQIDWDAGILHIRRVKNGSTVDLPLLPAVAKAMAVYLRHSRPQTSCRNVLSAT